MLGRLSRHRRRLFRVMGGYGVMGAGFREERTLGMVESGSLAGGGSWGLGSGWERVRVGASIKLLVGGGACWGWIEGLGCRV